MGRQSGMSTPIFDELLREMTEGTVGPVPPAPASPAAGSDADQARNTPPAQRRRHRAD